MISWKIQILRILLGIKFCYIKDHRCRASWTFGRTIILNPERVGNLDVLHEIGHVLNGYDCCREHDEWRSHGFAIAVARIFKLSEDKIFDMENRMDGYVDMHCSCPRIERIKKEKK